MSEVKWIKIVTDVFDDEKILMIETLPEADSIIVIWFKLLCLAGKQNNSGVFQMGRMPYTDEMFATIFRRPINTVRLALSAFEKYGMIEIINNTVTIPNWCKHQSLDQIESRNEYMRKYMTKYRSKQKAIADGEACKVNCKVNSKLNSKLNVNSLDKSRVDKIRKEKNRVDVDVDVNKTDNGNGNGNRKQLTLQKGSLGKGVVLLTDEQFEDLLDRLGLDAFNHYVSKLADFIIDKGANVSNHYATILKWYEEDSGIKGGI